MRQWSEKYVTEGSKCAQWIGLYLNFHLNWVVDPFVHGKLQRKGAIYKQVKSLLPMSQPL